MKTLRVHFRMLSLLLLALFVLLAGYGVHSVSTYGNRWFATNRNPRVRAQKENVLAGDIRDRSGTLLAHTEEDGTRVYQADATARRAVVHVLGDTRGNVANAVETFQTSYLYGFQTSLLEPAANLLTGQKRGDTVILTIDSRLCQAITASYARHEYSAGKNGAAVVMNYRTGEVLALISLPEYDPMNITDEVKQSAASPFWNRATQALYPPGSTFKIVTASAALENLAGVEDWEFDCLDGALDFGDHFISDYQGEHHGKIRLKSGFVQSCNKLFATLAYNLGSDRMLRTAQRFGFNDNFLFRDLVVENSSFPTSAASDYALAGSGFGQAAVSATPMHLCMIAGAIANGGVMMEPRMLLRVDSAGGVQRTGFQTRTYRTVVSPTVASRLQEYMRAVVTQGTGRRAAIPDLTICGKTGTADSTSGSQPITYGWFVGYAAEDTYPYAVAVVVENIDPMTSGGTVAAPIAGDIFAYLRDNMSPQEALPVTNGGFSQALDLLFGW